MSSAARSRRWRLVVVAAVVLMAFFYYRPLKAYFDTRHALQAQKRRLQHRLAVSTSPDELELEARRLALVKPGERLFIVKGIAAWERRHGGSIRRGG
jgi:hypothetical protein